MDRIRLYALFGMELIADYQRNKNDQWTIQEKPSELITRIRDRQLQNRELVLLLIDKGLTALSIIHDEEIRKKLISQLHHLIRRTSTMQHHQ